MNANIPNKYIIPVNTALMDSLSLRIPLDTVDVIDERLTSLTATVYQATGEVLNEDSPPKPIIITENGITVRIGLAEIPIYNKETEEKVPTKFIELTVSAKLLKSRYFEGINSNNIHIIYETFLEFQVFDCSLTDFLDGMVNDIDICVNRYLPSPVEFSNVIDSLVSQSGTKRKYAHVFQAGDNIGLDFNKRQFAKPSVPYIKLYHKELELLNNSSEFFNKYLSDFALSLPGLTRVEATIKNYKHKIRLEKFGILPKFRTLRELFEVPQAQLYNFVCFSLSAYVENKARLKAPNLPPMEHIIFELIENCILKGYDYQSLMAIADTFKGSTKGSTDVGRSRIRKKISELMDLSVNRDLKMIKQVKSNKNVNDYLRAFKVPINEPKTNN